nr:nucleoporin NDC1 [Ipomoea batatas]
MSLAMVERSLFKDKDGGATASTTIVKHRFLGFLIWQALQSTALLFFLKNLLFSPFTTNPLTPSFLSFFAFVSFHVSLLLFAISVFVLSTPHPRRAASPLELLLASARIVFLPNSSSQPLLSPDFRGRARVSLCFVLFVGICSLSTAVSIISVCWSSDAFSQLRPRRMVIGKLGFRGLGIGFFYGIHYVFKKRWILHFPIIQRPTFFSFKMGIPLAIRRAVKLTTVGFILSAFLAFVHPNELKGQMTAWKFITEQILFYMGTFLVFLCWELCHHLHQVLQTKRFIFSHPKGSAAAETNPSEPILVTLEESMPRSLLQYLAYIDLCMVCENNVDSWRRAALFEETGETYKRVVAVCLKPLEQFTRSLGEVLDCSSADPSFQLSYQLRSPTEQLADSKLYESFDDSQLLVWCARVVSSLTARSHTEDRYGVAQLSGSNAAVVSTLLSGLLAVEILMGKKTNLESSQYQMDPTGIKWATLSSGREKSTAWVTGRRKGSPLYTEAYSMADILRTSIYCIVVAFHDEMLTSAKAGALDKDWITSSKPLYGTRELLLQKLRLFLDFRAN